MRRRYACPRLWTTKQELGELRPPTVKGPQLPFPPDFPLSVLDAHTLPLNYFLKSIILFFSFFCNPYPRICLFILERAKRGRERGREREKHLSAASYMHPRPGIEPATFWCTEQRSNQLSHPARAAAHLRTQLKLRVTQGRPITETGYWAGCGIAFSGFYCT